MEVKVVYNLMATFAVVEIFMKMLFFASFLDRNDPILLIP